MPLCAILQLVCSRICVLHKESGSAYTYPCHIRSRVAHTHVCHIRSELQVLIWNFYLMFCNTTLYGLHYAELVRWHYSSNLFGLWLLCLKDKWSNTQTFSKWAITELTFMLICTSNWIIEVTHDKISIFTVLAKLSSMSNVTICKLVYVDLLYVLGIVHSLR